MTRFRNPSTVGLTAGLAAYVLWGFLPLLFHALSGVPPFELVSWRIVFTLPVCLLFVAGSRGWGDLWATLRAPGLMARLALSALLIATNWTLFVIAVTHGHVLATSLGYYINPLLNVLIGTLFMGERLNARQWSAVAIAGVGIALLLGGAIDMLGTAMALATSFAVYGVVRKLTPVGAITGLTVETLVLYLPALGFALACVWAPAGSSLSHDRLTTILLSTSGFATAVPLVLFGVAARHLPLSTLGFIQFAAPTISFLLGVLVLGETLDAVRAGCFVLIWTALAIFAWDMAKRRRGT